LILRSHWHARPVPPHGALRTSDNISHVDMLKDKHVQQPGKEEKKAGARTWWGGGLGNLLVGYRCFATKVA